MEVVLLHGNCLINSDNEGILKDILLKEGNCNKLWGNEYFVMNDSDFLEKNSDRIIEIMIKSREIAQGIPRQGFP